MTKRTIAGTEIQTFSNEIDYVLARPEIYIGSTTEIEREIYLHNDNERLEKGTVTINPGFYKVFVEALDNCIDEAIRTNFKKANRISVDFDGSKITIRDNGRGVPTAYDDESGKYTPELVYTSLRTGSNFDDNSGSETIGKNGVGVSLTNIFSSEFSVNINDGKQFYKQTFSDNAKTRTIPKVRKSTNNNTYTEVSFTPDYDYFKLSADCEVDLHKLIHKRVADLAFCYNKIKFIYNKKRIGSSKNIFSEIDPNFSYISSCNDNKVQVAVCAGNDEIGFVNGSQAIGHHVMYASNEIVSVIRDYIKKKHKIDAKPNDIKRHLLVCVALRMPKPKFDSQTKERLCSPYKDFGKLLLPLLRNKRFLNSILRNEGIIKPIVDIYKNKDLNANKRKLAALQKKKITKIAKFIPAQSKKKSDNILVLTEGDSAISGLINVRTPNIAGYPLRGKVMNVYSESEIKVLSNNELKAIIDLVGLEIGKKPRNLNYGKIAIMADMDVDGDGICGLLINFFNKFWPELFETGTVVRMLSPLYTVHKGKQVKRFNNKEEFTSWSKTIKLEEWTVKYYKGLGSLPESEYEEMLTNPKYITFTSNKETNDSLQLVYGPDSSVRKTWLAETKG